jgi:magnesium-transporting ATPase (P-type)
MFPALALGAEPPYADVMRRPPRPLGQRLLDLPLLLRAYLFLGPLEAVAAMAAFFFVLYSGGWLYGVSLGPSDVLYRQATTACLSAIIVMQVVNVLLCRHPRESTLGAPWRGTACILIAVASELALILMIDYTRAGNLLVGTAPIGPSVWLFMIPFALAMLLLEELRKAIARQRRSRHSPANHSGTSYSTLLDRSRPGSS